MPPGNREKSDTGRANGDALLRLQREANEKLVLAGIRAHEALDDALGAQHSAEKDTSEGNVREAELLATAEFRERMLGIIGHDLRNPLNTIIMACGLLIARGGLSDADAQLANRIVNSGQRMTRMIGQLVEFTQATLGGDFALTLAASDLGDVCRNIAEELRLSSSAEIRVTTEGDLGGTWDADRLAEVISNIAGNAVDHATPGTPVLIRVHGDGSTVVAEISNQGACIPPNILPVIFNAFRRGQDNPSTRTGHLGLGLYIAFQIARSHGGTLDARSSDQTTAFTLRLPRACYQAGGPEGRDTAIHA